MFGWNGQSSTRGQLRIKLLNRLYINDSAFLFDLLVLAIFFLSLYLTPVYKKLPELCFFTGVALVVQFVARNVFAQYARLLIRNHHRKFLFTQLLLTFLWSLTWGWFNAQVLSSLALGWTSYFLTVSTLAIAAAYTLLCATSSLLMVVSLVSMIWPILIVNAIYVPGLRGQASLLLLAVFWALLLVLGVKHQKKVVEVLAQRLRLTAILEAFPGAICWFDTKLSILGGNSFFYNLFASKGTQKGDIANLKDEQLDPIVGEIAEKIFSSNQTVNFSKEINNKNFYLTGQKYQFGDEALMVGIDISVQENLNKALEKERLRSFSNAKILEVNRLMQVVSQQAKHYVSSVRTLGDMFPEELPLLWKNIGSLHTVTDHLLDPEIFEKTEKVELSKLKSFLEVIYAEYLKKERIKFSIEGFEEGHIEANYGLILTALSIMIGNSQYFLMEEELNIQKSITVSSTYPKLGGKQLVQFFVEDNGPGVDEVFSSVIFEPHISTRKEKAGLGLAILKEIASNLGGQIMVENLAQPTLFSMTIPVVIKQNKAA